MATGLIITATSGPALPSVTSEHVCPCRASVRRTPQRQFVQTETSDDGKSLLSTPPCSVGTLGKAGLDGWASQTEKEGPPF